VKNYLAKQVYSILLYPFLFVLVMWIFFWMQNNVQYNFLKLGVWPRHANGMLGILTSAFIHGDSKHIASNTLPLLVLGMLLFYFYKKIARSVFIWIWLVSGIWLWIGGRGGTDYAPNYHIGASALVYGLAGFLFFSGVFRRHLRLMVVSALVVFLYGGIVWGIFPIKEEMSWEGHLFGLVAGILVAFNYRKEGPQRRVHQWDEDDPAVEELPWRLPEPIDPALSPKPADEFKITYIYKEKGKE